MTDITRLTLRREWHADARFHITVADTHISIENPSGLYPVHFTFTSTTTLPAVTTAGEAKIAPTDHRGLVLGVGYLWLAGDDPRQTALVLTE